MNLLSISLRNLKVRRLSTGLTILSIALGTALLATLWLLIVEVHKKYRTSISGYSLVVGPKEGSSLELVLNTVFHYGISKGLVPYSTYKELHDGKLRVRGMVRYAIPQCRGDNYRGFPIIGTTDEMFSKFRRGVSDDEARKPLHLEFEQGKAFAFGHEDLEEFVTELVKDGANEHEQEHEHEHEEEAIPEAWRQAVIGSRVAKKLELSIGDKFVPVHGVFEEKLAHLHEEAECSVVGILARTGTPLDKSIYIPLGTFFSMAKHDAIRDSQEKKTGNIGLSAVIVSSVRPTAAQNLRYDFQTRRDAQVALPFFEIASLLEMIGDSTDVLQVLSYIVLVVTASTVLLALYNTMNERRREIAIMRSLGARQGQIFRIILSEALVISLAAGALGVALCHAAVFGMSDYIEARTGISVDWAVFPAKELYLILGVGVLGSLAGILPAIKGSRTPVAENLGLTY